MACYKETELTQEIVKEFLHYDPESGELTWKERSPYWFSEEKYRKAWNTKHAGKCADYIHTNGVGYTVCTVGIFHKNYRSHRVIWLYVTGEWPEKCIDHIDRDATNNRWSNLRQVTRSQNSRNMSMMASNTSGVTGVSWNKGISRWVAEVWLNGKKQYLGCFKECDLDLATKKVLEFRAENGFSKEHGLAYAPYRKEALQ